MAIETKEITDLQLFGDKLCYIFQTNNKSKCFITEFGTKRAVVPLGFGISTQFVSSGYKSTVAIDNNGLLKLWWNEPL